MPSIPMGFGNAMQKCPQTHVKNSKPFPQPPQQRNRHGATGAAEEVELLLAELPDNCNHLYQPTHFFTKESLSEMSAHLGSSALRPRAAASLSLSIPISSNLSWYSFTTAGSAAPMPLFSWVSADFRPPAPC